jgi:undecaprenyl-diphosphatase
MTYWDAVILGLIQGLTEFLPISSSGHLVLSEHLLQVKNPGVRFELLVHFGTLLAVVIYFRNRIIMLLKSLYTANMKAERKLVGFLVIGTIPIVIFALTLKDSIESAFDSPVMVSVFLMVTGGILLLTALPQKRDKNVGIFGAIIIGLGQALAILPGISRSGTSISAGMFYGVKPLVAAEFSFLLSIPAIFGAIVYKLNELSNISVVQVGPYIVGTVFSFLSGLLAVYLLLKLIKKGRFMYFGVYCLLIGLIGLIIFS